MSFKLSIVIPNYNGQKLLEKNLPAVFKALAVYDKENEVIVVDDASADNSVAFLKINYPQIKIVAHQQNQRFARACNSGVETAEGEIVVLLNSDVAPEADFLSPLLKHFTDPRVFSVGCKERNLGQGKVFYSGRGLGEFKRGFLVHRAARDLTKRDTLWADAGAMAVSREKWLQLGGMDDLFRPAYWEDIDLSWRARKKGWLVLFEPESVINHNHESTNLSVFGKKKMKLMAYKNQFLFVWKNAEPKLLLQHLFWLPYHLLKTILKLDFLFWLGFLLALSQLPELLINKIKK